MSAPFVCLFCNVLLLLAVPATGHRNSSDRVGNTSFIALSSPDDPMAGSRAMAFLKSTFPDSKFPSYKFKNMKAPGTNNKSVVQAMFVNLLGVHFSVPDYKKIWFHSDRSNGNNRQTLNDLDNVDKVLCVFANPSSGGRMGDKLLSFGKGMAKGQVRGVNLQVQFGQERQQESLFGTYQEKKDKFTNSVLQVLFFDITDSCQRAAGIYALHRLQGKQAGAPNQCISDVEEIMKKSSYRPDPHLDVRAAAAGGDGTITWLIDELYKIAEPPVQVPIGAIPLGTGNDLSRQLNTPAGTERCQGAGSADALPSSGQLVGWQGTLEVVAKLSFAPTTVFDVWHVEVSTYPGGDLEELRKGKLQSVGFRCVKKEGNSCSKMRQTMGNYASVGFESIIGLEFESWRSKQKGNTQLSNKMEYAKLGVAYETNKKVSGTFPFLEYRPLKEFVKDLHDGSNASFYNGASPIGCNPQSSKDMDSYKSLMIMNVECVMGGKRKWPRDSLTQPSYADGLLEVLSFQSPLLMAVPGHGAGSCAVGQYKNPTVMFMPNQNAAFQIDGEYYAAKKISEFNIGYQQPVRMIQLGKNQTMNSKLVSNPTVKFGSSKSSSN